MAIYVDDRELVAAHQAGDTDAFDELVREYRPALFAHGRRKLYCDEAAEDAVQETLVRAYRALPRFNGEYQLGPWLHRIMANVCIDEAHRRSREGEKTDLYATQPSERQHAPSPEDELGLDVDSAKLQTALNDLSDTHREALVLRFVDDLEYEQVAAVSGVSEQNARARVSRARSAMRAALKGVAVLPALLTGFLKRGEKAAAAATSGGGALAASASSTVSGTAAAVSGSTASALPTIAEAAVAATSAAPAAVPVLAKAVVGVGLAAAVLTPTSDSLLHSAVEDIWDNELLSDSSTSTQSVPLNAPVEVESAESGEGLTVPVTKSGSTETDVDSGTSVDRLPEFERGTVADSATPAPAIGADQRLTGSIKAAPTFISTVGSGRYVLSGPVQLQFDERIIQGVLSDASTLSLASERDDFGELRLDALLVIAQSPGEVTEARLVGFAVQDGVDHKLAGLFSISSEASDVVQRGTFKGTMQLAIKDSSASMELLLAG